ncbi:MAG: RICIN domain-containing protein [Dehalococcoidia bacterium]
MSRRTSIKAIWMILMGLPVALSLSVGVSYSITRDVQSGRVYHIHQVSSGLNGGGYVDAYVTGDRDFRMVTRGYQDNDTQSWRVNGVGDGNYTISQLSTGRFWDAHESADRDFQLVTRERQNSNSQRWKLEQQEDGYYTIMQVSTGRFVDAYDTVSEDFRMVTRPKQSNNTQRWSFSAGSGGADITNCLPLVDVCF